ncbi:c-type cytochrome [Achromobacter insolitus]|uniref:c-type cytochrome n=1 Tax=Achromobacter insolitus TaxID=217204 RepID=UPI00244ED92E|nr:c-type cytochrome [Achromobacter insolitus]MDH3062109.1 c-type cytochrome [Achromobacter insolitus]
MGMPVRSYVTLGLIVAAPLITLVATFYQMYGQGGDGSIAPSRVEQPPAPPPVQSAAPAAAPAAAPTAALPAVVPPKPSTPVPGRSALDFSVHRPAWEAALQRANVDAGKQLAQAGKAGVQACVACHGPAGITPLGGAVPNLAGLSSDYLAKQLWDFRDGSREHPLMSGIAKGLSDEEIAHLARYYGGLPTSGLGPAQPDTGQHEAALRLDTLGDGPRALPACANCHGLQGRGEGPLLPRLAGQPAPYFVDQMNAFRSGLRKNDDVGAMRAFAQRLTPDEIGQLARYYQSRSAGTE